MKNNIQNDETIIDLSKLFKTMLMRWRFIIIFAIIGALVVASPALLNLVKNSVAPCEGPDDMSYYSSTTTMEIVFPEENREGLQAVLELTRSNTVMQRVIRNIKLEMEPEELGELVFVSIEAQNVSGILEIKVLNKDAHTAKGIADEIREVAKKFINSSIEVESFKVIEQANLPNETIIVDLSRESDEDEIELEPEGQSSVWVNIVKRLILGGMLGTILAIFIIFIQFIFDDSVQTAEDVERFLGKPVLASIPMVKVNKKKNVNINRIGDEV